MPTITVSTSQNISAVPYAAADTLDITSGAVFTIDLEDAGEKGGQCWVTCTP